MYVGIDKDYTASHLLKTMAQLHFLLLVQAMSTINPFKQPKCVLKLKLANLKLQDIICLPD